MASPLDCALKLASRGIPVFPCYIDSDGNKRPRTAHGFKDATTDVVVIRAWWDEKPFLVGVPTGRVSGMFVLDLDRKKGKDGFSVMKARGWKLPVTMTYETRNGGRHYVFEHQSGLGITVGKLGAGIDTRGDGGYVIWWPAHGAVVTREWELARVPEWILGVLKRDGVRVDFSGTPSTRPENVGKGSRNTSLHMFLSGGEGRRCGSKEDLLALAMTWNRRLAEPMSNREVGSVVNKKWAWLERTRPRATERLAIDRWSLGKGVAVPKISPIVGDILYPGLTLITAKMKEGKTFLVSQMAVALASGTTFLNGSEFPGFSIPEARRVILVAGEDNRQTLERRIVRNMKAGHLPDFPPGMLEVAFPDQIAKVRLEAGDRVDGARLAEQVLTGWYEEGFRVVFLDPLRAWEAGLGINEYPGTEGNRNVHTRDFLTTMWYNQLADRLPGLCIVVSLHHGKNKRDHDASDPGDMIAGTTGLGAGAMTTISLLPRKSSGDPADGFDSDGPKQRELYIHGRLTREKRLLVEQGERTGLWACLGDVMERGLTEVSETYFGALRELGGEGGWVRAEDISKLVGRRTDTIHRVLGRMIKRRAALWGRVVAARRGVGYRLVAQS